MQKARGAVPRHGRHDHGGDPADRRGEPDPGVGGDVPGRVRHHRSDSVEVRDRRDADRWGLRPLQVGGGDRRGAVRSARAVPPRLGAVDPALRRFRRGGSSAVERPVRPRALAFVAEPGRAGPVRTRMESDDQPA